jgi:peptidoglycan/xylan/chitin deacetylase (PgdA/CDA1 family)
MPVNPLSKYVKQVEAAFRKLPSGYIERYEEEWLTTKRVNLRIRVRFPKGQMLEWNEAVIVEEGDVDHLAYRYHFQARDNKVIFRYDNTPHFPGLKTFPHHTHLPDNVLPANRPSVLKVLDEVIKALKL